MTGGHGTAANFMDSADFALTSTYNVTTSFVERSFIYTGMDSTAFLNEYGGRFDAEFNVSVNGAVTETLTIRVQQ
jgi:hypothetical protein